MSREAAWKQLPNNEYGELSLRFRKETEAVIKAARQKKIQAATAAYGRTVSSCVQCHQFVREKRVAWNSSGQ